MGRRRAVDDLRPALTTTPPTDLPALDPFDLPEWLGTEPVTWQADSGVRDGHLVTGRLREDGGRELACDLLAVDDAHPLTVADDVTRRAAHLAWRHGQVHLVERDGRTTLAAPGATFTADGVLDAVERLARAVGADARRWTVQLLLGVDHRH